MGISVGELIHQLRASEIPPGSLGHRVGKLTARHFSTLKPPLRMVLKIADLGHAVLGKKLMSKVCRMLHDGSGKRIPLWTSAMPRAYTFRERELLKIAENGQGEDWPTVVYFPSCINQTFGTPRHAQDSTPLAKKTVQLLRKAGFRVVFPKDPGQLCCGMIWESKGMPDLAEEKVRELESALWEASEQGKFPILCDQSPCLYRMKQKINRMRLYDSAEFVWKKMRDRLEFKQGDTPIAIHLTCSTRKMGIEEAVEGLARLCSTNVLVPEGVGCCGYAGDKGMTHPELNAYALRKLRSQIEANGIEVGYSNSRTCEIGLSTNSGVPYRSIIYLVNEHTK